MLHRSGRLELVANVSLIAASLTVLLTFGLRACDLRQPSRNAGYQKGERLPSLAGVHYADASRTVLLFISTKCRYCLDSMPFYAKLAGMRSSKHFQLLIVGTEPESALAGLADAYRLAPNRVLSVTPGTFLAVGTPTLLVADRSGRIVGIWVGLLRDREQEVLAELDE